MLTHRVGVLPCRERIKPCWVQIKPCWHLLPIRETGLKCLFVLVCFLQLNCSNVVAISSDKAGCEGCAALFWYVVTLTKALHSLFELLFQVVTFLSVLYNSDILTISVREGGCEGIQLVNHSWFKPGWQVGKKSTRPGRRQFRECGVEVCTATSIKRYKIQGFSSWNAIKFLFTLLSLSCTFHAGEQPHGRYQRSIIYGT